MNEIIFYVIVAEFIYPLLVLNARSHKPFRNWVWNHYLVAKIIVTLMLGCLTDMFFLFIIGITHGHISHIDFAKLMIGSFGIYILAIPFVKRETRNV